MSPLERRAAVSLAGIYSLRMLGLFLILPVFALYATDHLSGVTPLLVGVALGVYGLTQALLQIPAGMLSDRIGRQPVIVAGLLIFAAGSVVAALADSIYCPVEGCLYFETDEDQYSFHVYKDWTVDWAEVADEEIKGYEWTGIENQTWALDRLLAYLSTDV